MITLGKNARVFILQCRYVLLRMSYSMLIEPIVGEKQKTNTEEVAKVEEEGGASLASRGTRELNSATATYVSNTQYFNKKSIK